MRSVELFAGAGGLALGCELAGFETVAVAERDRWACDTIRQNQRAGFGLVKGWSIREGDIRNFDWEGISDIELVSGGPPCQPFSAGGRARAAEDPRDMFPITAEVIRQLQPSAFIIENVRGLTRPAFATYFSYIQLRLRLPELVAREGELWNDHYSRLQAESISGSGYGLSYNVIPTVVNAANYGVPQSRWRVFLIGFRSDIDGGWTFPRATHSAESLLADKWITGEYWERNGVAQARRPEPGPRDLARINRVDLGDVRLRLKPWRTVREALSGLPQPSSREAMKFKNHEFKPGARAYKGHTGSPIDLPSKALKAGGHGVPGGENMLRAVDGTVRYFTVRESARIQTFPDDYELHGSWGEAMRQLGNAVPVKLAHAVAESVSDHLRAVRTSTDFS